jgi:hypothetical protein
MAMILKMGAGGDAQHHVSTPVSIIDQDQESMKRNSFSQRASSASVNVNGGSVKTKSYANQV